jgi:hypothetical protein
VPDTARKPGALNLAAYTGIMSVQREELLRLVEELPEEEVPAVLDDVRRHLRSLRERPWPPAWFGAGEGSADDVAARSEDLLRDVERSSFTQSVSVMNSTAHQLQGNMLFGAVCLLALVMEKERWPIFDYSDDQVADMSIGLLDRAKTVFICRGSEAFWDELQDNLVNLGLRPKQSELLSRWAVKEINFT